MRNLKKILALVLALMMTVSLMVVASAASYKDYADADEIGAEYETAVAVLTGMGVFQGDEDGFRPQDTITRAEVSTAIYRTLSGDVTDSHVGLYTEYGMFDDVPSTEWYAGFVNYAANVKWVIGVGNNKFDPNSDVTGYEMLAILLRALGYDQNGEFAASKDWRIEVATIAEQRGLSSVLNNANLSQPVSREEMAALLWKAIQLNKVGYTPAYGYQEIEPNITIGSSKYNLTKVAEKNDDWGRAQYGWSYNVGDKGTYWDYDYTLYTEAKVQCDVAAETGVSGTVTAYNNGVKTQTAISATATTATIGAQGRQTYVYPDVNGAPRVVFIDTYLAMVTKVNEAKVDAEGHVYQPAYSELIVWFDNGAVETSWTISGDDYAAGTMLLVNVNKANEDYKQVAKADYTVVVYERATAFRGTQSYRQWTSNQHTVNGQVYDDAVNFWKDDAGHDCTINFDWWLDQYDNLIGVTSYSRTSYAVLKDLTWTDGNAVATLINMDGSEYTAVVSAIDGNGADAANGNFWSTTYDDSTPVMAASSVGFTTQSGMNVARVSHEDRYNDLYDGFALYLVYTKDDGTVNLQGFEGNLNTGLYIGYANEATLNASGSEIYTNPANPLAHVDASTQIIVNNGDGTYSAYTGTNALATFANSSIEVFWSELDGTYTDAVYIKLAVPQAATGEHLFTTNKTVGHEVDNTDYYEMLVYVDGVERTIVTDEKTMRYLENNTGKLFHVEWDESPLDSALVPSGTYGYVDDVMLVNEATDGDFIGTCNYLSKVTLADLGNGAIMNEDGHSYNLTNATQVIYSGDVPYTIDNLAAAIEAGLGIWVVDNDDAISNDALTIYVGTKLSSDVSLMWSDDSGADKAYTKQPDTSANPDVITVTLPEDVYNVTLSVYAAAQNAVLVKTADDTHVNPGYMVDNRVHSETIGATYALDMTYTDQMPVTVWAEDGVNSAEYSFTIVTKSSNSAIGMLESVTLNGEKQDVPQGYSDLADAVDNPETVDLADLVSAYKMTIVTKQNTNGYNLQAAIKWAGGANAAKQLTFDSWSGISGTEQDVTGISPDGYVVISLENYGDVAYYAYQIVE